MKKKLQPCGLSVFSGLVIASSAQNFAKKV